MSNFIKFLVSRPSTVYTAMKLSNKGQLGDTDLTATQLKHDSKY